MNFLTATLFQYTYRVNWDGHEGKPETQMGSYLGRKPATPATVKRFLRKNWRDAGLPATLIDVTVFGSSLSKWRFK